jgi:hypothetical protein
MRFWFNLQILIDSLWTTLATNALMHIRFNNALMSKEKKIKISDKNLKYWSQIDCLSQA